MRDVHHHGDVEGMVRAIADRAGWSAQTANIGEDPWDKDLAGRPKRVPYRGDVILRSPITGAVLSFEYELPEIYEDLERTIMGLIRGDQIDRARRVRGRD